MSLAVFLSFKIAVSNPPRLRFVAFEVKRLEIPGLINLVIADFIGKQGYFLKPT